MNRGRIGGLNLDHYVRLTFDRIAQIVAKARWKFNLRILFAEKCNEPLL